jgi:catechol 2,3-dioxygenase-like lactoylglutathione lyase family enzyme
MLFMIIERFKNGDARPVYERFRDRGRMAPDGLHYLSSWVDTALGSCYQVMETDDRSLIDRWIANWSDLTDFEVVPVLTSSDAAARVLGTVQPPAVTFGGVTPVFRVERLDASIDYYVNVLGFTLDFRDPGIFASVSREKVAIFLAEGDQGPAGTWAWVGVSAVDALFEEYRRTGARIRQPPTNFPWALEMQVEDLDGHVLRFGSDSKAGMPFGPWLDMNGVRRS